MRLTKSSRKEAMGERGRMKRCVNRSKPREARVAYRINGPDNQDLYSHLSLYYTSVKSILYANLGGIHKVRTSAETAHEECESCTYWGPKSVHSKQDCVNLLLRFSQKCVQGKKKPDNLRTYLMDPYPTNRTVL